MKIGDRVRVIDNTGNERFYGIGAEGIIVDTGIHNDYKVKFDKGEYDKDFENTWWVHKNDMELVTNPLKELADLVISFMKATEATHKDNAIPQATVAHYCKTTEREVRRANEYINNSIEYDFIINRSNEGNYITRSKHDLSNMRNREIRKLKQAIKRIKKIDYLNNDNAQFNINDILEEE